MNHSSVRTVSPAAWYRLGIAKMRHNEPDSAATCFQQALALDHTLAEAWLRLGELRQQMMQYDEAQTCYQRAQRHTPHNQQGAISQHLAELNEDRLVQSAHSLGREGKLQEATDVLVEASSGPSPACSTLLNLGIYLHATGRSAEGLTALKRAVRINPGYAEAWQNMGLLHQALGELPDAYTCFRRAITLRSDYPTARWNFALLQLLLGEYLKGFANFEQRLFRSNAAPQRHTDLPRWQGENISGKTLLVVAEQGYGDTIQFLRYFPLLAAREITAILEVQDNSLVQLAKSVLGVHAVITRNENRLIADLQIPILSLPYVFGTTSDTIPPAPYCQPDAEKNRQWKQLIGNATGFKAGLVWAGNRGHNNNANRSIPLNLFSDLLQVEGVTWYSLQIGSDALSQTDFPDDMAAPVDLTGHIYDFSDSAAFIANLDLVITVDTSTAHLAGAIGTQVWTLIPFAPDWRWILGRADTPWYSSMTLFRQQRPGEWQPVLAQVARQLAATVGNRP